MRVIIRKRALNAIIRTTLYVESLNTPGSGDRWVEKLKVKIGSIAKLKAKFPLCRHLILAKFNYSCYYYKDWIIVFKANDKIFEVCRFIHGSRMK